MSDVLRKLEIPIQGNNGATLKKKIEEYGLDISHFTLGRKKKKDIENYIPVQNYLFNGSSIQTAKLKEKLLKEHLKENKCEKCGLTEWQGNPITMQLHHIDGNNHNNEFCNLQMLCPNCHSQTENYCGSANRAQKYYCPECGFEMTKGASYCNKCAAKHRRRVERPTAEQLIKDFEDCKSLVAVGELYGVKDNTIRLWLKSYGLPHLVKELKEYIKGNYNE